MPFRAALPAVLAMALAPQRTEAQTINVFYSMIIDRPGQCHIVLTSQEKPFPVMAVGQQLMFSEAGKPCGGEIVQIQQQVTRSASPTVDNRTFTTLIALR